MTIALRKHIEKDFGGESILLRGDGSIHIPEHHALLVADLHLGKDASFRAAGVPVPVGVNQGILKSLGDTVNDTQAEKLFILGDMIHDRASLTESLTQEFQRWQCSFPNLEATLVLGNHDRRAHKFPRQWRLQVLPSEQIGDITLLHETEEANEGHQIGGHIHPATLAGKGADAMRLKCFVVDERTITLPAFGPFKGGMLVPRKPNRRLYPTCDGKIWKSQ